MEKKELKKTGVTVESADTLCGEIPHMTVDELAARLNIASRDLRCPACGRVHLSEEDVKKAQESLFSETDRFRQIKSQAEGSE